MLLLGTGVTGKWQDMSVLCRRDEALTIWSGTKGEMTAELNVLFFFSGEEKEVALIKNCIACQYVVNPY